MKMKTKLSTLWIVVMLNMIFADILGFMVEFVDGGTIPDLQNVEMLMLVAAVVTQIPIWMVFLSRHLKHKSNRIANILAAAFTIFYVVAGAELAPHYLFIALVEVLVLLYIIHSAWGWKESD